MPTHPALRQINNLLGIGFGPAPRCRRCLRLKLSNEERRLKVDLEIPRPRVVFKVGERMKMLRHALNLRQADLDRMLGAGGGVVRQHESGRRKWPRVKLTLKLINLEKTYARELHAYLQTIADQDKRQRIRTRSVPNQSAERTEA
jgi:DNA-binding transcriptional regulator YiaG